MTTASASNQEDISSKPLQRPTDIDKHCVSDDANRANALSTSNMEAIRSAQPSQSPQKPEETDISAKADSPYSVEKVIAMMAMPSLRDVRAFAEYVKASKELPSRVSPQHGEEDTRKYGPDEESASVAGGGSGGGGRAVKEVNEVNEEEE